MDLASRAHSLCEGPGAQLVFGGVLGRAPRVAALPLGCLLEPLPAPGAPQVRDPQ